MEAQNPFFATCFVLSSRFHVLFCTQVFYSSSRKFSQAFFLHSTSVAAPSCEYETRDKRCSFFNPTIKKDPGRWSIRATVPTDLVRALSGEEKRLGGGKKTKKTESRTTNGVARDGYTDFCIWRLLFPVRHRTEQLWRFGLNPLAK